MEAAKEQGEGRSVEIVIAASEFAAVAEQLRAALPAASVAVTPAAALRSEGARAEVLVPAIAAVDGPLMDRVEGLRLIQQWGVGVDRVDLEAARARSIAVANVPSAGSGNAESVAEWCVMAAIAVSRRLPELEAQIRRGGDWGSPRGRALFGRTACIVGLGGIGAALAPRLRAFGMRLVGASRRPTPERREALGLDQIAGADELAPLLGESDYLFVCLPAKPETMGLIGAAELAALADGAIVVSAGRGGVVDEPALSAALAARHLGGAALDVFANEPVDPGSDLLALPNLLATPHIAGVTDASYEGIARRVADNVTRLLAGQPLRNRLD